MFKLFGKKKAETSSSTPLQEQQPTVQPKHPEAAALAAQFGTEEFEILAVTGANRFGGEKAPDASYWTATLPLTAWREGDGPIHQEDTCLMALADDTLLEYLRRRAPKDSIIQARVRQGLEDHRFLLVGLPTPIMDAELKVILDEQVKEISHWVEGLGTFTLNRSVNWFQADIEWLGQGIQLVYDNGTEAEQKSAQETAQILMSDQAHWDEVVRRYAADSLLSLANDYVQNEGTEEEESQPVTREDFTQRMELDSLQVWGDDRFAFWFQDAELFWGHAIQVSGTLTGGPNNAQMEE
ncbi:MAG: DUF2262 domain-containing protein [Lawsonibacter sp.]|jgi:hypothetical protein